MFDSDLESFQSMLDAVSGMLSNGKHERSAEESALFFNALLPYSLAQVSAAFSAHVKDRDRGRFVPKPADIIDKIEQAAHNERPGVEQAWSMTPTGEDDTVVWTTEMAEAHAACAPLLSDGDRIGARMTFKEVYSKLVTKAVAEGRPVQWVPSLGWDMEKRKRVLLAAVEAGRLPAIAARDECQALPLTKSERLALPPASPERRQSYREKLTALVAAKRDAETSSDPKAWARELKRRDEAGDKITTEQREAYKRALHYSTDEATLFTGGALIPVENFPPAMRAERARAYARAAKKQTTE
ncbi:MAG: hypothetical protein RL758_167 [Pseudomonadota bacterium]|jgi:hypothetical protein